MQPCEVTSFNIIENISKNGTMWNWKIYLCNSMSTLHDSPLDLDPETNKSFYAVFNIFQPWHFSKYILEFTTLINLQKSALFFYQQIFNVNKM